MIFIALFTAGAEPVLVSSSVDIIDQSGLEWVHIAETSKESFEYLSTDWWSTLPIQNRFETFPEYSEELLSVEGDRLLQWYIDHGWRGAVVMYEVVPYQNRVLFPGPRNKEAYTVDFKVYLGEEWTLDEVYFHGLEKGRERIYQPNLPDFPIKWNRKVQDVVDENIRLQLGRRGYANPDIYWQSKIVGDTGLGLEAHVEWGEQYTFGTVQILNDEGEAWSLVQSRLSGRRYTPDKVNLLLHRLEGLPSVAAVDLQEHVDSENKEVDLVFTATPNNTRTIEGVGGFATQATAWAFNAGAQWEIRNRRSPSVLISGRHTAGYRTFPQWFDLSHDGWAMHHQLESIWALVPKYGVNFLAKGDALWDLQMGYQEQVLQGEVGLRLIPHPYWTLDWTYGWNRHRYDPVISQQAMFDRWFGDTKLEDEALTSETSIVVRRVKPGHALLEIDAIPYGMINGANFQRLHVKSENHTYKNRWLWRNRMEFGVLRWTEDAPKTLHNRFFLGGGVSLRGWGYNKVHVPNYQGKYFDVNIGGEKAALLSTELQYTLVSEYRVLTFLDVGRVWEKWDDPMPWYEWYPSTGIGVILPTMLGDVALTGALGIHRDAELLHNHNRFFIHCVLMRELGE